MIYLVVLADAVESVRDTIGFDYHSSIWCAPFEALYGRKCRSPVLWAEIEESSLTVPELVLDMTDKVVLIKEKLKAARDRQKSYADNRRKPLEFEVGDRVMLKVSPWKGVIRFGKKGKLAPRYVGPFEILERVGPVAYRLRLPEELSGIKVDKTLRFVEEPVENSDREVKRLKCSRMVVVKAKWLAVRYLVKVSWNSKCNFELTWVWEDYLKDKYPRFIVWMDDLNMIMEEYIKLEEEKARRRGRVFNWQTTTYGKIRIDDDLHDLSSVEAEFPAIVINDAFATHDALQCKSQVSILVNDEIEFRISFDESDDKDYTITCDKNSFSYKMISVNDLKTDSENDYEKVMPLISSLKPTTSYIDDLDFFKDFENEFPAIVYNDAQTSKSDLLTKPILNPQHIDEFDLNDETSLSEYDEEEQNILYFNDLFPFNTICPDDLKLEKDNDIDITQSLLDNEIIHGSTMLFETSHDKNTKYMALPPCEQRHQFLRVPVFDFGGLPDLMAEGLSARMLMEHWDDRELVCSLAEPGGGSRRRMSWREFILALGLHTDEEMQTAGFGAYWAGSARQIPDKGGPERQPDAAAGAPAVAEDASAIDEGNQAPPPPPSAAARTIPQRLGRLEEDVQGLRRDVGSLRGLVERSMTDQGRFSMWMMTYMTQLMDASGLIYQTFGPRERDIDKYWWKIYKSGDLEVLES
ncbi:hypothetical protein Tco_1263700 [Tanacetum coccineum]